MALLVLLFMECEHSSSLYTSSWLICCVGCFRAPSGEWSPPSALHLSYLSGAHEQLMVQCGSIWSDGT